MFNKSDRIRNGYQLNGPLKRKGYDWWWHSFTAINEKTGEERPFFVEYFTCNPKLGGSEPVLGQLPENKEKGIRPSYLMVKAGCWGKNHTQLHKFIGWDKVTIANKAPFELYTDDFYASDDRLKGSISITEEEAKAHPEWMCDAGEMTWDLKVKKLVAFNVGYGASGFFRFIKAFEMYWHAEGMKSTFEGTITFNGETFNVIPSLSYGYADKNWGRGFTSPWVWLSSNCLVSNITGRTLEDSVFDIGGGRPKVFFVPLNRKLLSAFWREGKCYEFNFSKFWTHTKTAFSSEETEDKIIWDVRQETTQAVMETHVECKKADMLLVNYEAPDGSKRHNRLWNGGNGTGTVKLYKKEKGQLKLIDDILATHIGCEYGEYC